MCPKGLHFSPGEDPYQASEVQHYRSMLCGRPDILAHVSAQTMELARRELSIMPERSGEPTRRSSHQPTRF